MSTNFSTLPVAPEFVESLRETVTETLKNAVTELGASEDVLKLVEVLDGIAYYFQEAFENPSSLSKDNPVRYEMELTVVEAVNAIANLGGTFKGAYSASLSRKGTLLAK